MVEKGEIIGGRPDKRLTAAMMLVAAVQRLQYCHPDFQKRPGEDDGERTNADEAVDLIKSFAVDVQRNCEHLLSETDRLYKHEPEKTRYKIIDGELERVFDSEPDLIAIKKFFDKLRPCNEFGIPKNKGVERLAERLYVPPTSINEITRITPAKTERLELLNPFYHDEESPSGSYSQDRSPSNHSPRDPTQDPTQVRQSRSNRNRMKRWEPEYSFLHFTSKPSPSKPSPSKPSPSKPSPSKPSGATRNKMGKWEPSR